MTRLLLAAAVSLAALAAAPAAAITFTYTGSIVTWTVPEDGIYTISATGAQGGQGQFPTINPLYTAGRGARVTADFMLTAGTVLQIAVGGRGGSRIGADGGSGGGGGGSFVVGPGDTPMMVGAGGGGVDQTTLENGWDANDRQQPRSGDSFITSIVDDVQVITPVSGGTLLFNFGQGGQASSPLAVSAGGAGFYSNGQNASTLSGGLSWFNGLAGGLAACVDGTLNVGSSAGGFGGGGAANCSPNGGGGGGGGYSGGQGGIHAGGGGGSFIATFFDNIATTSRILAVGMGYGDGLVTINWEGEEVAIPEPASATLALMGLLSLAALRRRR